jgi:hypothetical protein
VCRMRESLDLLNRADRLGVEMIYFDRQEALTEFAAYLKLYVKKPDSKVYIVGSSLKGVLATVPDFRRILYEGNPTTDLLDKKLEILLTHPSYARFREHQENRAQGDIADEVFQSMRIIEEFKLTRPRLYKGTPTCFMIATEERMLLNPYPYETEAYKSFCLTVRNIASERSIYRHYFQCHFSQPWNNDRGNTAVEYERFTLEGPNPGETPPDNPDFFVIPGTNDFYLAVFLQGRLGFPPTVFLDLPAASANINTGGADSGRHLGKATVAIGDHFKVRLLRIDEEGNCHWEDFRGELFFDKDQRRGKVLGTHPGRFEEFSMIGVESVDPKIHNRHKHDESICPRDLKDEPLPLYWRWLDAKTATAPGAAPDDEAEGSRCAT